MQLPILPSICLIILITMMRNTSLIFMPKQSIVLFQSKLKKQIKDPNAVELVHYLFSPLAMIVHTCCGFELPRTIKTPLLQGSTIAFLRNCTTTQEMELLERLGDFWIRSKWVTHLVGFLLHESSLDPSKLDSQFGNLLVQLSSSLAVREVWVLFPGPSYRRDHQRLITLRRFFGAVLPRL